MMTPIHRTGRKSRLTHLFIKALCLVAMVLFWADRDAFALVIHSGNTGHDTPVGSPIAGADIWDNIGWMGETETRTSTASGVYLGDGWVIAPEHVYDDYPGQSIKLNDTIYHEQIGHAVRLTNPDGSEADLVMFRIEGDPGLQSLTIRSTSPASNDFVTIISTGRVQLDEKTYWDVDKSDSDNWKWTELTGENVIFYDHNGYETTTNREKLWGTNTVRTVNGLDSWQFATRFDTSSNDAQAVANDSGGAMFTNVGGEWQLTGIIQQIASNMNNIPGTINTAVYYRSGFAHYTLAADMSDFQSQINQLMGNPYDHLLADLNMDNAIDTADWQIFKANFHKDMTGKTIAQTYRLGDVTLDGKIDMYDFGLFKDIYNEVNGPDAAPLSFSQVPEPATLALLAIGGLAMLKRRH